MHVKITRGHELATALAGARECVLGIVERLGARPRDAMDALERCVRASSGAERIIYDALLMHAAHADAVCPGGGVACLLGVLRPGDSFPVSQRVRSARRDDIWPTILGHCAGASAAVPDIVACAIDLAGRGGRVTVREHDTHSSVELVNGYTFTMKPAWPIRGAVTRARCVCIDGRVESVGELHHLLEGAAASGENVMVFMRGACDDVVNTLRVNYDRGTLRVVPIVVPFDLEGINSLNDVAVVCGARLTSSITGDLISSASLAQAPYVDEVTFDRDRVVIVNGATVDAVGQHLSRLREKRASAIADVATLLDRRIESLTPNYVIVRVRSGPRAAQDKAAIDYALRAVRALAERGVVESGMDGRHLAAAAAAGRLYGERCRASLECVGAIIHP